MGSTHREGEDPTTKLITQKPIDFSKRKIAKNRCKIENNNNKHETSNGLNMLSFNCRSLRNKLPEIMSKLDDLGIDVCVLQETWLSKGDSTVLAEIKDFGFEVRSRRRMSDNKGGGVAITYKTHVESYESSISLFPLNI